jgi:predicted nucleic acid-binding protein
MEKASLRSSAFVAITLATVAIAVCIMTLPMLFHYVQRMEANAQMEIEWCYKRSRDMWRDVTHVRQARPADSLAIMAARQAQHRARRSAASSAAAFWASSQALSTGSDLLRDDPFQATAAAAAIIAINERAVQNSCRCSEF